MRLHRVAMPPVIVVAAATGARELEVGWSTHISAHVAGAWGGRLRLHRVAMPPAVVRAAATGDLSSCARSDWLPKFLLQSIGTLGVAWHARVARSIWTPTVRPIDRCKNSRSNFSTRSGVEFWQRNNSLRASIYGKKRFFFFYKPPFSGPQFFFGRFRRPLNSFLPPLFQPPSIFFPKVQFPVLPNFSPKN